VFPISANPCLVQPTPSYRVNATTVGINALVAEQVTQTASRFDFSKSVADETELEVLKVGMDKSRKQPNTRLDGQPLHPEHGDTADAQPRNIAYSHIGEGASDITPCAPQWSYYKVLLFHLTCASLPQMFRNGS
jgi:hypothetical protein